MSTYVSVRGDRSHASQRVVRVMAVTLEVAALILLSLNLPPLLAEARYLPVWWTVLALLAVAGPACAALILGRWINLRALRYLCGIQASTFLASLVLIPVALGGERLPMSSGAPWLTDLCVIAGAASAVCWGGRGAIAYGAALQVAVFALVFVSDGDPIPGPSLNDAIFGVFYVTLFTALAVTLRQSGFLLDRTVERAVHESRASATADAVRTAKRRVASLIHDRVIVALLTYGKGAGLDDAAEVEAQRALTAIGSLNRDLPSADRSPTELAWEIQGLTTELDPEAAFDYSIESDESVPPDVAQAITEAASEALRNSIRHARADLPVAREVRVMISNLGVEVLVLDDGEGFEVRDIPPGRLGVRQGIIGRLATVPGGSAMVNSTLDYGTVVALRWAR